MKIICVDTDIHKYGAPEIKEIDLLQRPDKPVMDPLGSLHNVSLWVNLGDNIEINNCLEKNLDKAFKLKDKYMKAVDINVPGNHDLDLFLSEGYFQSIDGPSEDDKLSIKFEHGHLGELWELGKGLAYVTNNKPGCGRLKYLFTEALHKLRNKFPYKLKLKTLRRITQSLTKNKNVDVLILGHAHPESVIEEIVFNGTKFVKIYILPQGRHYFKIMKNDILYLAN